MTSPLPPPRVGGPTVSAATSVAPEVGDAPAATMGSHDRPAGEDRGDGPPPWVVGAPGGVERRWRQRGMPAPSGDAPVRITPPSRGDEIPDDELVSNSELADAVDAKRTVGQTAALRGSGEATERQVRAPSDPAIPEEILDEQERIRSAHDVTPVDALAIRRRRRRRIHAAILSLIGLVVGYYLVSLYQVWSTGRADEVEPVDAIVVMGAAQYDGRPSPQLAARLDHVVELWPSGVAPLVVVTGGNLPGDRFTEAEASAAYLVERGVPGEVILQEGGGSNSYESLEGAAALLAALGHDDVLIVTDPYHALRSRLIAEEVGLDARVSSTDTSVVSGASNLRRHLQEAAGVSIGRIVGFDRLTSWTD